MESKETKTKKVTSKVKETVKKDSKLKKAKEKKAEPTGLEAPKKLKILVKIYLQII